MKRFLLLLAAAGLAWACGKDGAENPAPKPAENIEIPASVTPPVFDEQGGNMSLTFTAHEAWSASVDATRASNWCSVAPESGAAGAVTLTVTTLPNDTPDERNATIFLKAGTTTKTLSVTQKQQDALTVTSSKFEVGAGTGEIVVELKANIDFDYKIGEECAEWVSYVGTRALKTSRLVFRVAANEELSVREGSILLRSSLGDEQVKIYQQGADPALVLTQKSYTVPAAGETIKVELNSNVDYTVQMPEAEWITEPAARAMSTHTHYFVVAANDEYDGRTAEIVFTDKANNLSETVTVTQVQKNAVVLAESRYEFGTDGGKLDFDVLTNVDLTVAVSDDAKSWITQVTTRGLEQKTLHFDIATCSQETERTGTIHISGGGVTQTVTVAQGGLKEVLEKERAALVALYNATGGDNWANKANWCSDRPVSEWYGVTVDEQGRVLTLVLENNNLTGSIPAEFCELGSLIQINFSDNPLSGVIPAGFGNLSNLTNLSLYNNGFSDISAIFGLPSIRCLFVTLPGENIPVEIGNLSSLTDLQLYGNDVAGVIPKEIGNLVLLRNLDIVSPKLSGSIPEELFNCTNLEYLRIYSNYGLSGSISPKLGLLTQLKRLELNNNNLTGPIPDEICNCSRLVNIFLQENKLTGSIPEGLGNLPELRHFIAFNNNLSGNIPASILNHRLWDVEWALITENNNFNMDGITIDAVNFSVTDIDGNTIDSKEEYAKNKYTILFQFSPYFGDFTDMKSFIEDIYDKYKGKGVDVIGYSSGHPGASADLASMKKYVADNKIPWRNILWTETNSIIGQENEQYHQDSGFGPYYPYHSYPAYTVVDSGGKIVFHDFSLSGLTGLSAFLADHTGGSGVYESSDYSKDGEVTALQTATRGNGINIVLLGDAFSDRLVADGTYDGTMRKAMEHFFSEEPYKSFRDLFNVYAVNVVSKNEAYGSGAQTALDGFFGDGTHVGGNDDKCRQYAMKVPGITYDNIDNALIIVMMNRTYYAGTCYMYYPSSGDYGQGLSIAYFPLGTDDGMFGQLLHHEAGGHGFPKLADEYAYEEYGQIPWNKVQSAKQLEPYGWWRNIDFTGDVSQVKWSRFITDPRYAAEVLGAYEGADTYWSGVWRPTYNSIMRYNTGGFNAPSREAIYYRINKLAYGDAWAYDYETFVAWDAVNRTGNAPIMLRTPMRKPRNFVPLHPPVVVKRSR